LASASEISGFFSTVPILGRFHIDHINYVFFRDYACDVLQLSLGYKNLTVLFGMSERIVRWNLLRGPQVPGPLGRHVAIDNQSEADFVVLLLEAFERAGQ
jgi:hypothetical protein